MTEWKCDDLKFQILAANVSVALSSKPVFYLGCEHWQWEIEFQSLIGLDAGGWKRITFIKILVSFTLTPSMNDNRCGLFKFRFTWLFGFFQKAKECYGRVLSAWFLFSGGREWVRQPDGWSLWFSRWLFCVVLSDTGQAHWHAASLPSISSPPLPSPPPPAESLLRRWIPAPWPLAADLERMGRDSPLSPPKKMSIFGLLLLAPVCHRRLGPARLSKFQVIWGMSGHRSEVRCSMLYCNVNSKQPSAAFTPWNHQPHTTDQLFLPKVWGSKNSKLLDFHKIQHITLLLVSDFITSINYHIGTWLLT